MNFHAKFLTMKFTQNDFYETFTNAEIIKKIDKLDIRQIERILDEMYVQQPFFLSVILGYRYDVNGDEFDEIVKLHLYLWEYFRKNKKLCEKKVTNTSYEKAERKHLEMLKYTSEETNKEEIKNIYANDLQNLNSKSLWALMLYKFNSEPVLQKMSMKKKGPVLIEIKSFIECFENL